MALIVTIANHSNLTVIVGKALAGHSEKTPWTAKGSALVCPLRPEQNKAAGEEPSPAAMN
jgi:hypothetical protein